MQSRQIQLFGVIGTAVLILFTVIFFGKDFYHLYLNFTQGTTLPTLSDEQIVMEADAMKNLQERLDKEAAPLLKKYHPKTESKEPPTREVETVSVTKAQVDLPEVEQQPVQKVNSEAVLPSQKLTNETVSQKEVLSQDALNRQIRVMMRQTPFFRHSMALSKTNKHVLDQVAAKLAELPGDFYIVVEGHTEAGVSQKTSETMSMRVKQYLMQKLPGVKIESVGYGNDYPIIDEANNKENRRVEILIRRDEK